MDSHELPKFLTVPSAARALGIGRDAIRAAIRRGRLRAVVMRPGGWPRIEAAELVRWAESLEAASDAQREPRDGKRP